MYQYDTKCVFIFIDKTKLNEFMWTGFGIIIALIHILHRFIYLLIKLKIRLLP